MQMVLTPPQLMQSSPLVPQRVRCVPAEQTPFWTQLAQQPPLTHRPPVQAVRFATFVPSAQTGAPVVHETTPVLHALGFPMHAAPGEHATQLPVLHTPPGQAVPMPTLPDSTHTPEPELQLMLPVLQGLAGEQPAPPLHGLHEPPLHTPPGHTALPVAQSMTPLRHVELGFVVQPSPALRTLQKPPLHTPPGHAVPLVFSLPSEHTGLSVPHVMVPFLQAEPGLVVHPAPALQAVHAPALSQTWLVPLPAAQARQAPVPLHT